MTTQIERLEAIRHAYAELAPRVMALEPWPLAEDYGNGPEASWGPHELLAHIDEMLPFWLGELERVIDGAESGPVPFGRTADEPVRAAIIGRDRTLPLRVLFDRIDAGFGAWADRLVTLGDSERSRVGVHPSRGEMPASEILERFIIGHANEHVTQLNEILAARAA